MAELERSVSELSGNLQRSEQKYQLLVSKKVVVKEVKSGLETKVDSLSQVNEGLMIQVESLERDAVDCDRVITALQASADVVQRDLDWLLQVGVVRFVDRPFVHPKFTSTVSLIRHSTFVAGVESVHVGSHGFAISAPLLVLS